MNLFQAMQSRRQSKAVDSDHLPEVNSFVDVAVGGKTEHLPIEELTRTDFRVRRPTNAKVGASALFNYSNRCGRFRFHADCVSIAQNIATFTLPSQITVIEQFGNKRRNMRLKVVLPVTWRYAPDGEGYGDFVAGNTADLSCVGMALIVPRDIKVGTQLEIKLDPLENGQPFAVIAALTRAAQKQPSGKFLAGVAFKRIRPTEENQIAEFIALRQRGQRKRALAD